MTFTQASFTDADFIQQILASMPKDLPNYTNRQELFPDFQKKFTRLIKAPLDTGIRRYQNETLLQSLSPRSNQAVLSAALQFQAEVKGQIRNIIAPYLPSPAALEIPNYFLYSAVQNPNSFINNVRSYLPYLDDDLLLEIFMIIQNTKISLLQDLSSITNENIVIPKLSKSDILEPLVHPRDKVKRNPTNINNQSATPLIRKKRGRSSFRSSFWGSASEEEVQKLVGNEVQLESHELQMQDAVSEVSDTNRNLLQTFKDVSIAMDTLESRQEGLFSDIQVILKTEDKYFTSVDQILATQDRTLLLTSEYLAIQAQNTLINTAIQKLQNLIATVIFGNLDLSQADSSQLRALIPNNLELSLSQVESKFLFKNPGYSIVYKLPIYSKPFFLFRARQVPFFKQGSWHEIANISQAVAVNSMQEQIPSDDILNLCKRGPEHSFICISGVVRIFKPTKNTCMLQLITAKLANKTSFSECHSQAIYYKNGQKFLQKEHSILLAVSEISTELNKVCHGTINETAMLNTGLYIFNLNPNCSYETTEIVITPLPEVKNISDYQRYSELAIIDTIAQAESELSASQPIQYENLEKMIDIFGSSITPEGKTVQELESEIQHLNSIDSITKFNPIKFNLANLNHASLFLSMLTWFSICVAIYIIISIIHCLRPTFFRGIYEKFSFHADKFFGKFCCKPFT